MTNKPEPMSAEYFARWVDHEVMQYPGSSTTFNRLMLVHALKKRDQQQFKLGRQSGLEEAASLVVVNQSWRFDNTDSAIYDALNRYRDAIRALAKPQTSKE